MRSPPNFFLNLSMAAWMHLPHFASPHTPKTLTHASLHRIFDFGADAKTSVGIPPDLVVPPFAVVASNKFDEVRLMACGGY